MRTGKMSPFRFGSAMVLLLLVGMGFRTAVTAAEQPENQAAADQTVTAAPAEEAGGKAAGEVVGRRAPAEEAGGKTAGDDFTKIRLTGYIREYLSFNLQDHPETKQNDSFDLQMARTSLWVDADGNVGDIRIHAVGRASGEIKVDYLKRLENLGAASGDLMKEYNVSELREGWIEFKAGDRTTFRLGKQQVVWGESDFFQAMDVVHGFDFTWRSFLEPENEEYRKPLVLANAIIQVPEAKGSLQLLLRPALDRNQDIGSTFDFFGGRWAAQPNKGINFLPLIPYNFKHPDGNTNDVTWGVRWAGLAGPVNYSLSYLRTFGPVPVVNSAFAPFGTKTTLGALGEFIFPKVDLFGLTLSAYSALADAVFSAEVAYTKDQFFNVGTNFLGGALPGFAGIIKKDTVRSMLRMDKIMRGGVEKALFASRPPFFSVQLFDTWVQNFKQADDIVDNAGFGGRKQEHSAFLTAILGWNYMSDRVNPTLAAGWDLSYGGQFVIPSVDFAFGDKWRLKTELDLFFPNHSKSPGQVEQGTHVLGFFKNNNQLYIRLTRQF